MRFLISTSATERSILSNIFSRTSLAVVVLSTGTTYKWRGEREKRRRKRGGGEREKEREREDQFSVVKDMSYPKREGERGRER
jgi:hypothetical protein